MLKYNCGNGESRIINMLKHKLPYLASVVAIDGCHIAFGNITEEIEPIRLVLDDLAYFISFNVIGS